MVEKRECTSIRVRVCGDFNSHGYIFGENSSPLGIVGIGMKSRIKTRLPVGNIH